MYENELNYNKFYQESIDRSYSLTLVDEINSLLHVALHSATVTNLSKDLYSAANDRRPQMISTPEMIPKLDRKWSSMWTAK